MVSSPPLSACGLFVPPFFFLELTYKRFVHFLKANPLKELASDFTDNSPVFFSLMYATIYINSFFLLSLDLF